MKDMDNLKAIRNSLLEYQNIVKNIRKLFPQFQESNEIKYFDNSSTSLTPATVIEKMNEYYYKYNVNSHRTSGDITNTLNKEIAKTRKNIANYLNINENEVSFHGGGSTTLSNLLAYKFILDKVDSNENIILVRQDHSSTILPWITLAKKKNIEVRYIDYEQDGSLNIEEMKSVVDENTSVLIFTSTHNMTGNTIDVKSIGEFAKERKIISICDITQTVPTKKIDLSEWSIDIAYFSSHKFFSPSGLAVLYINSLINEYFESMEYGGGMNITYDEEKILYKPFPHRLEAGTQNIPSILGLNEAIEFRKQIENKLDVENYLFNLRDYLAYKLNNLDNVEIYNLSQKSTNLIFNIKNTHPEDVATELETSGFLVRAGSSCVKLKSNSFPNNVVRVSLSIYNTLNEVDEFIETIKNGGDFLNAFFKTNKSKRNNDGSCY